MSAHPATGIGVGEGEEALSVACPVCEADIGQRCVTARSMPCVPRSAHHARRLLARPLTGRPDHADHASHAKTTTSPDRRA